MRKKVRQVSGNTRERLEIQKVLLESLSKNLTHKQIKSRPTKTKGRMNKKLERGQKHYENVLYYEEKNKPKLSGET